MSTAYPEWQPISSAPKDGTLVDLWVDYSAEGADHPLADDSQAQTVGFNNLSNTGEDEWLFAGWCWSHDHFTQGQGTPLLWRPRGPDPDPAPPLLVEHAMP